MEDFIVISATSVFSAHSGSNDFKSTAKKELATKTQRGADICSGLIH
jgi:hypothetical protein